MSERLGAGEAGMAEDSVRVRVSVVLPTRNRFNQLRRALASLEQQTYRHFETWVVDDASADETADLLRTENLRRCFPGLSRLFVLTNDQPCGAAASRNRALRKARGEYIAFLDDDDAWLPEYLEWQVACLDARPEAVSSCANCERVEGDGGVRVPDVEPLLDYPSQLVHLLTEAFVHSMSVFVCRRTAVESVGLMNEKLSIVHDLEWYARLMLNGGSIVTADGPPLVRRSGPGGLVTAHRDWYLEERHVIDSVSCMDRTVAGEQRKILAYRSLFFARTALRRGDYAFAARRAIESLLRAPARTLKIAIRRILRNRRLARAAAGSQLEDNVGHD